MTLEKVNPVSKLAASAIIVSAATYLTRPEELVVLTLYTLIVLLVGRAPLKPLLRGVAAVAPMAIGLGWFNAYISAYRGGDPLIGLIVALRVLVIVLVSAIFALTTDPDDFAISLTQYLRLPHQFSLILTIAYTMMLRALHFYSDLITALKSRWVIKRELEAPLHTKRIMVGLISEISRWSEALAQAMELKGYGAGERTQWRKLDLGKGDVLLLTMTILVTVLAVLMPIQVLP